MFQLGYRPDVDAWCLTVRSADQNAEPNPRRVCSTSTAVTLNEWVHLAAVFDATAGTIKLYVNGVATAPQSFTAPWNATGPLTIGRARTLDSGVPGAYWRGELDEVRVYSSAITDGAVVSSMLSS
jgi:hypothetical protein